MKKFKRVRRFTSFTYREFIELTQHVSRYVEMVFPKKNLEFKVRYQHALTGDSPNLCSEEVFCSFVEFLRSDWKEASWVFFEVHNEEKIIAHIIFDELKKGSRVAQFYLDYDGENDLYNSYNTFSLAYERTHDVL